MDENETQNEIENQTDADSHSEVPQSVPPFLRKWITEENFYVTQIFLGFLFILVAYRALSGSGKKSSFKDQAARPKSPHLGKRPLSADEDRLAHAKMKRQDPVRPLALEGIVLTGEPHEILGVSRQASSSEIQKAYRDKMKQYHPDKIGRPGSREWKDAQKIAESLNQARDALLRQKPGS